MSNPALLMWLSTVAIVTALCIYFFTKVLISGKKKEPDSYSDNEK